MKRALLILLAAGSLLIACAPASNSSSSNTPTGEASRFDAGSAVTPRSLDPDDPLVRYAASFAEAEGLSLEEAVRRLEFQATIGDIQPALMADLPDTYAGLWIENQPQYRIAIALTEGDETTIQPYVSGKAWAEYVEVRPATYSLAELTAAQEEASRIAGQLNLAMSTAVDVMGNRVELLVGNPDLFQADLTAAGLNLPEAVSVVPITTSEPLPDTNQGVLFEALTADGRTIYLPKQPPTAESMAALMEGELVEVDGCLRITSEGYKDGFLILWPHDADIRVAEDRIEVLDGAGRATARVGQPLRLGGGAMESSAAQAGFDESIPGLPLPNCPGPYWVAGQIETLVEQSVSDIYVGPFSSGDRILAIFVEQSRPSQVEGTISGKLTVDEQGCMRAGDHVIFWPPGACLLEDPLRVFDKQRNLLAQVGDTVELAGAEKGPQDYRYFDNKMRCPGPYWGVGEDGS
jgi:hypothetical protein